MGNAGRPHPLDPLAAEEIERAWAILQTRRRSLGDRIRVVSITLHEPPKDAVLRHRRGDAVERSAFVVLMDSAAGKTYEAIVSLTRGEVVSWEHIPGVQPAILFDEFPECEETVREDPRWQEAMRKRGVTDFSLAMIDPWPAGYYGARTTTTTRR